MSDTPLTTLAILDRAAAARPDATALICGDARLTYRDYARAVAVLAARLAPSRGGVVAIMLPNGLPICIAIFAAQRAGAATATLNPDYTPHELGPMLADARPAAVIAPPDRLASLRPLLPPGAVEIVVNDGFIADLLAVPAPPSTPPVQPDQPAVIQFTGGTSGAPKGVVLTHRAVATNVAQREARLPTAPGDEVVVSAMPLFHVFAVAMGLHLAAHARGTLVILPRYRPDWLLDAIERHGGTRLPAGPTIFQSLLNFEGLSRQRLATLRCCYSGSAPLPAATLDRWEAATGVPIYEGYGQSEAGPILTYFGPSIPVRPGAVGPALPGTELQVVDPADPSRVLPPGEPGEVRARGPQIMTGYLNRPEETARALRDSWLHTGDIGMLDRDGILTITGRAKEMIIVGGYNVYPREVEDALLAHSDVAEAAVVGVPDGYRGETVRAFVVPRPESWPAQADLFAHCEARLVKYKRPAAFALLPALPRTSVGKVDKAALKVMAQEELSHVA